MADVMLPVELIGMIVDFLHDDKPALKRCALVCSTWTISSRFHLFRSLEIPLQCGYEAEEMRRAVQCFTSPLGSLCGPFVRKLKIGTGSEEPHRIGDTPGKEEQRVDLHDLGKLLNSLSRLQSLSFMSVVWSGISSRDPKPLTATVDWLRVTKRLYCPSRTPLRSLRNGLDILHLFPRLKSLYLVGGAWYHNIPISSDDEFAAQDVAPFPEVIKLESLHMQDETSIAAFVNFSRNKIDFTALKAFSAWWFFADDVEAIGEVIHSSASHLQTIDLRLHNLMFTDTEEDGDGPPPEAQCSQLCLKECTALRTFQLFVPVDTIEQEEAGNVPYWDIANTILEELPPCVHHISLIIGHDNDDDTLDVLDVTDWEKQARIYKKLPELKSVTFSKVLRGHDFFHQVTIEVKELITERLPALQAQGILQFYGW